MSVQPETFELQRKSHSPYNGGWFDWFYQLLDVAYGVDLAVQDVLRLKTRESLKLAMYLDAMLLIGLFALWWRFDLYSTFDFFTPATNSVLQTVPGDYQWIGSWLGRIIGTLLPTLVQWRYPSLAQRHRAAWLILVVTVMFDMWTDYPDVHSVLIPVTVGQLTDLSQMNWLLRYLVEFVGIITVSFAAQSMTVIQFAKVRAIQSRLKEMA